MAIRRHNVAYAAARSLWVLPVLTAPVVVAVLLNNRTIIDFLWGFVPAVAFTAAYFGYWLWRTQRRLPPYGRAETNNGFVVGGGDSDCGGDA